MDDSFIIGVAAPLNKIEYAFGIGAAAPINKMEHPAKIGAATESISLNRFDGSCFRN